MPLLEVRDLAVSFGGADRAAAEGGGRAMAVDGASLTVYPGQTVAVVGESGCGKSVTAMSLLRLLPSPPARIERGIALFRHGGGQGGGAASVDLLTLPERALRRVRGGQIAMIFQEPMTSLNPVYTVGDQIIEAVLLHQPETARTPGGARAVALAAMEEVGISDAARRIDAYPHQFSGGMRQRVMIAMALACRPSLLLADEPTTALDVTVQAQVLALLREIQRARGMAVVLITHALGVVAENADVVCVMYAGRVVEYARVTDLFDRPLHPYTRGLLACVPPLDGGSGTLAGRLRTVREVVDDPAEFARLVGHERGLRPWWPWHEPPTGAGTESRLVEMEPGHWVALWATSGAREMPAPAPDLPDRFPQAETAAGGLERTGRLHSQG